ncbi:hypothetical protein BC833DRAFT_545191 [Globomyces pollinis-pini]|nr:hypothetical protein BC833DRAFT_545191 [Globomyces pollinis-pini]
MNTKTAEILILGLGWQGQYVKSLFESKGLSVVATSTSGKPDTIPFKFDPITSDLDMYSQLPDTKTILITFPLPTLDSPRIFQQLYHSTHSNSTPNIILLGSTRPWSASLKSAVDSDITWYDRHSPVVNDNRYDIESELLKLNGAVLNLAGLWGNTRHPSNWISRVASTKVSLASKGSLHLIHGIDVARVVLALHERFTPGERWIVTDGRIYDWFEIALGYSTNETAQWVQELMEENKLRALPRPFKLLGRVLDSKELWHQIRMMPSQSLYNPQ